MSILEENWNLSQQAQEFFVYTVLGITKNEKEESIIEKCIRRAYLDMNRTLLLNEPNNKDDETDNDFYRFYSKKLLEKITSNLNDIKSAKEQAFGVFFAKESDEKYRMDENLSVYLKNRNIKDKHKRKGQCFYYGQAQKWVNMTLKYLWLVGIIDDRYLDVPIDSYIMQAASESLNIDLPRDNLKVTYGEYSSTTMPWSKLSKHEYEYLETSIKEEATKRNNAPMKWEHENWIRISEKRKGITND